MRSCVLDFIQVTDSQTAEYLRDATMAVLKDYGIAHKILGLTADGAPNITKAIGQMLPLLKLERTRRNGLESKIARILYSTVP